MVSLNLFALVMLGFMGSFVQSRRVTESSVLHAAATSLVYGIIEQIKGLEYTELLPSLEPDPNDPLSAGQNNPYPTIRVRLNQDKTVWLRVKYTRITDTPNTPKAPATTPAATAAASSVGTGGAIDNSLGAISLSTLAGAVSQDLSLNLWIWVDELDPLSFPDDDVTEVKMITIVYTYTFKDGRKERVIRDREVFLRTRFDQ
ncbi:type IV pilus modification PilV family protein [Oleiharenicola lentus]|uniref:type IV pilus modification PilV family protein n=1 Tax=Oleiharenicola lentus TaxID=2508720 RepID=UPI003F66FB9E